MRVLNRRSFLLTASALGFAHYGLHAALATPAQPPRPKRKFTMDLVCGAIGVGADQRETIRLAHQYGFESVGPSAEFLVQLSPGQLDQLLAELKSAKLVWGAAGLPVDFRGPEDRFREGMKQLPAQANALNRAGVTRMGTWISPTHRTLTYVANFRQHAARLREAAKVLGDSGVRLGLEYVAPKTSWTAGRYPFIHTMIEAQELIAEIGQPNVGLVLDSWHWYNAEETDRDILSLRSEDVIACDLNDAPPGIPVTQQKDSVRDLPAATGVIDLKAFLSALVQIGYDGPIRAEPFLKSLNTLPPAEAVSATAAAMRKAFALVD